LEVQQGPEEQNARRCGVMGHRACKEWLCSEYCQQIQLSQDRPQNPRDFASFHEDSQDFNDVSQIFRAHFAEFPQDFRTPSRVSGILRISQNLLLNIGRSTLRTNLIFICWRHL
jgi:hypothetical protein